MDAPKRVRMTRSSEQVELCCSCTWYSTYAINKCSCRHAGRPYRRCHCFQICTNQPGWLDQLKDFEETDELDKYPVNDVLAEFNKDPTVSSLPVTGRPRRLPGCVAKRSKVASFNFNGSAGCFMYHEIHQPATQKEEKERRGTQLEVMVEETNLETISFNNQRDVDEDRTDKDNEPFEDLDKEVAEEEEAVEPSDIQQAVTTSAAPSPTHPTLPLTSL